MSDAIQSITQAYPTLTDGEKKIADLILASPDCVLSLTVTSLATKSGVSIATVSRFAQHLGFNTYKELQIAMARQQGDHDDFILHIGANNDCCSQIEQIAAAESDTPLLTLKSLDVKKLETCAKILNKADKILFFGLGTSFFVSEDVALKFKRLQKTAIACNNTHDAAVLLSSFTENDVVIGVSHSGKTEETCKILHLAQKRKVATIAITTFPSAPVNKVADYSLFTMTREIPQHRIAFTSRMSQLFLLDALFLSVLYQDKDNNLEKIEQAFENISFTNV